MNVRTVLSALLVVFAMLVSQGPTSAQESETAQGSEMAQEAAAPMEMRVYDVGPIVGRYVDCPTPTWNLPLRQVLSQDVARLEDVKPRLFLSMDELIELVRHLIDPAFWDETPGCGIEALDGADCIAVRATSQHQFQVARLLEQVSDLAQPRVRLDVLVVRGDGSVMEGLTEGNGNLSAARILSLRQQKIAGLHVESAYWTRGRIGQRVQIQSGQTQGAVMDFDAQVATESKILDPFVGSVFSGMKMMMRPTLLVDGRIGVRLVGSLTAPPSIRTREVVKGSADLVQLLSLPSVHLAQTVAAKSQCGAVFALASETDDDGQASNNRYMIVVPTCDTPWTQTINVGDGAKLTLMRLDALLQPTLHAASLIEDRAETGAESALSIGAEGERVDTSVIESLIQEADESAYTLRGQSDQILFASSSASSSASSVVEQVAALGAVVQPRHIDIRLLETSKSDFDTARTSGDGAWMRRVLQAASTKEHVSLSGGACINGMAHWAVGSEFTFIADLASEIAAKASIQSIVVRSGFTGLELRLRLRNEGQGRHGVEFNAVISGVKAGKDASNDAGDLGVEQLSGPLTTISGQATANGSSPCILRSWIIGTQVHMLVIEVR